MKNTKNKFSGVFISKDDRKEVSTDIEKKIGDIKFKIVSNSVEILDYETDIIVNIVFDELRRVKSNTGQIIAKRITKMLSNKICATCVDGGSDGKSWLIKVSNNYLEFSD